MTELPSPPVAVSRPPDHNPLSLPTRSAPAPSPTHPPLLDDDTDEIKCICGIKDDDGSTVACDKCDKWQHQLCYYPEYDDQGLPDDLQHYCVGCEWRPLDAAAARQRQRARKDEHASTVNGGAKRPPSKSHKKKPPKEVVGNGGVWDKSRHDRTSASPRDLPPPAKRPKTTHRTSDSTTTILHKSWNHSRKRNASSASHSPDVPILLYSDDFFRSHGHDSWKSAHVNLHSSITVRNALSHWLAVDEATFRALHHHDKPEVLMRWDGDLDDIPGKATLELQNIHDERWVGPGGQHPSWKAVTVTDPVASGAYIGELKGEVGFKDRYQDDPSNRWPLLRHPEPYVFFHPRLPIYIDARVEGTHLRFIRRSCTPNAKLQILVTNQTDYRFCFMATQQIDPGMEVAVGWDTSDGLPDMIRRSQNGISPKDMDRLSSWVSTVLANYGPCACQLPEAECRMSRFDRRRFAPPSETPTPLNKRPLHMSPLHTTLPSRSGSETRRRAAGDMDDEHTDSRSASCSVSRDITPHAHYPLAAPPPEVSQRERKKLAKEEEMFRRQEKEQTGKGARKKRHSAGTPTASRPPGPAAMPSRPPSSLPHKPLAPPPALLPVQYCSTAVQCDRDREDDDNVAAAAGAASRPYISTVRRLLERCALRYGNSNGHGGGGDDAGATAAPPLSPGPTSPDAGDAADAAPPRPLIKSEDPPPTPASASASAQQRPWPDDDDDLSLRHPVPVDTPAAATPDVQMSDLPDEPHPHLPMHPPVPPWPSQHAHAHSSLPLPLPAGGVGGVGVGVPVRLARARPAPTSVPMPMSQTDGVPTPPLVQSPAPLAAYSSTPAPPTSSTSTSTSTPAPGPPPREPAITPLKKKMSLSDYTRRSKAKDREGGNAGAGGGGGGGGEGGGDAAQMQVQVAEGGGGEKPGEKLARPQMSSQPQPLPSSESESALTLPRAAMRDGETEALRDGEATVSTAPPL